MSDGLGFTKKGEWPLPNDLVLMPDHTVATIIATVVLYERGNDGHEETVHTVVLLTPSTPYFRVAEFHVETQKVDAIETFENLVDAINGTHFPDAKAGFVDRGGDR